MPPNPRLTAVTGESLFTARSPVELDVRWINLDDSRSELLTTIDCLSADERERAERLRTERLRERFRTAHVFQRLCLAEVLGCGPDQLAFDRGRWGKPALLGAGASLEFNLSHCEEGALLAIARDARIGVDLERVRLDFPWAALASRIVSAREQRQLLGAEGGPRDALLSRLWTRKEAVAKATGTGLTTNPRALDVGLFPSDSSWRRLEAIETGGRGCWLCDLPLTRPWVGAVAVLPFEDETCVATVQREGDRSELHAETID
jgi:4'-phosphopantetheinyl transferase